MSNQRILLVDDNESLRITTAALLADEGYLVMGAASLAEARQQLGAGGSLACAILDLNLGDGNGSELIPELRSAYPGAAIVILTGTEVPEPRLGADLCLLKGLAPEDLVARINAAVGRRV